MPGRRVWRTLGSLLSHLILIIASLSVLLPILWVLRTSLVTRYIAYKIPPVWLPALTLENYRRIFEMYPFQDYFVNSTVVAVASTALALVLGSLAAYSFARFRTGGNFLRLSILSTQMLPAITLVIPFFLLARLAGLWDTHLLLVLAYLSFNLPYTIWTLVGFFQSIPVELDEAALIDGCSRFQAFVKIVVPVSLPGLLAAGVLNFILCWNEFMFALILTGRNARTMPVAISSLWTQQGVLIGAVCAATILVITPVVIMTFFVQRFLVRSLTFGAVK